MKIFTAQSNLPLHRKWRLAGFTLIEVMFSSALLVMVILALLSVHLVGLRLGQLVESKAGASDSSRRTLNQLPADIRQAKMWSIGNWVSGTTVTSLPSGNVQGTALQLFVTTNGSQCILYNFDLSDSNNSNGKLIRTDTNGVSVCLASNLVNWLGGGYSFTAEDYNGVIAQTQGGRNYKNIIHTTLQFCQFLYPKTPVGTNGLYDYYKIEFKATPHLPE